jgi:hypothetical protein
MNNIMKINLQIQETLSGVLASQAKMQLHLIGKVNIGLARAIRASKSLQPSFYSSFPQRISTEKRTRTSESFACPLWVV